MNEQGRSPAARALSSADRPAPRPARGLRSIAMFSPNNSSLYFSELLGLRKQLMRRGVDAHVGWGYLNPMQLAQFCDLMKPDVVLEIDRARDRAEGLPRHVKHVAWVQDWRSMGIHERHRSNKAFEGSDFYLFLTRPAAIGIDAGALTHWGYLLCGTDPEIFFPSEAAPLSDFSLMGYIPPKHRLAIGDQQLMADLGGRGVPLQHPNLGTVRELVEALKAWGLSWNSYDVLAAHRFMNDYIYERLQRRQRLSLTLFGAQARLRLPLAPPADKCMVPDDLLYGIENLFMRAQSRKALVDAILGVSTSLRIFGIGEWETYPEYQPYFHGPLHTEAAAREMFVTTRINLHNAMSQVHARALDCMASGAVIFVNKIYDNTRDSPECLRHVMEPGVHYFEYDDATLPELARELLGDEARRRRVGKAAREAILAGNTWSHRVDQLLDYLAGL